MGGPGGRPPPPPLLTKSRGWLWLYEAHFSLNRFSFGPLLYDNGQNLKSFQVQGGFVPLTPSRGSAPDPRWGLRPQIPGYRLDLRARHCPPPISGKSWIRPFGVIPG